MAKDKTKQKSAEDILMELHSNTSIQSEQEETSKQLTLKEKSSKEDLKDLVTTEATKEKNLTETDYLILEQHCLGVDEKVICDEFNITKGYLRSLFRNSNSSKFVEKWSQSTQQKVLTQSTANIATGMDLLTKKINKLILEGKEDSAIREMFGKLSLVEVHEKLAKLNSEQEEDTQAPIQNLFLNLQQR
jgi:hypothetical protein